MKNRLSGVVLTVFLSVAVLVIFFGKILKDPDNSFFAADGDGFKAYYGALYHLHHDPESFRTQAMNYPYGEMVAFTDSQPLVVNSVKFLRDHGVVSGEHLVAVLNLLMLASLVLGALFLLLIFYEMDVAWWFGALASVGIVMLSPQVARMGGHFSLAWLFWIPALIYWLIRFDKTRRIGYSLLIGVTTYLAGEMHLYFIGFFGFLIGGYWGWRFIRYRKSSTYWYRDLLHFFLQFVFPLVIIQVLILLHDDVVDRTTFPFGFRSTTAHPLAIFLPSGPPWAFVPRLLTVFRHIPWESWAYVGTVAMVGFWIGAVRLLKKAVGKSPAALSHEAPVVRAIFWITVLELLFAFGIPFVYGLSFLADHLEPVRQLRALARFSWPFFYMLNIVVFAAVYHKAFGQPASLRWKVVAAAALLLLFFEGGWNVGSTAATLNHRIPELEDRQNVSAANSWVAAVNPDNYQAIIPIPYFHVGSENIWITGDGQSDFRTMLASLKTGLPTTGVKLSRTSIAQTFASYSLFTEPLQPLEFISDLPNEKPFLVLVTNGYQPGEIEQLILQGAEPVCETDHFRLLRLPVEHLRRLPGIWHQRTVEQFENSTLVPQHHLLLSKADGFFREETFDEMPATAIFKGAGAFSFSSRERKVMWEGQLSGVSAGTRLWVSFWVNPYQQDAVLRTHLELTEQNQAGEQQRTVTEFFRYIWAFYGEWALIEVPVEVRFDEEKLTLSIINKILPHTALTVDELLIREAGVEVWQLSEQTLFRNGRRFQLR